MRPREPACTEGQGRCRDPALGARCQGRVLLCRAGREGVELSGPFMGSYSSIPGVS